MQTIEQLAEQLESLMPADVHNREVRLPNGSILQLTRSRVPGLYCDGCGMDLMKYEHDPKCAVLAVETETARRREAVR